MLLFSVMGLLSTATALLLTYAAWVQVFAARSSGTVTGMLHIPLWPFYVVECFAMLCFSVTLLYDTILSIGGIFSDELSAQVRESWS
jgi:hypothetical protein